MRNLLLLRPNRPHYGSCPSVCLYACPLQAAGLKRKGIEKPVCMNVPRAGVTDVPIFSPKGQRLWIVLRSAVYYCVQLGGRPHMMSSLGRHLRLSSLLMPPPAPFLRDSTNELSLWRHASTICLLEARLLRPRFKHLGPEFRFLPTPVITFIHAPAICQALIASISATPRRRNYALSVFVDVEGAL